MVMRYFDPSYLVRSSPANAEDSILCDLFARHAVHAAMAGKTGLVIGLPARQVHSRAHRTADQPEETPGPGRLRLERGPGRDRPAGTIRVTTTNRSKP